MLIKQVKSGGFISNLQGVKEQINFTYFVRNFEKNEIRQITEFCKIIADVLTLLPESDIVIDGERPRMYRKYICHLKPSTLKPRLKTSIK